MERIVTFDGPKAGLRFELLRAAMLTPSESKTDRTPQTIRKEARLLDALDSVSQLTPTPTDPEARTLKVSENGALRLTLAQPEFELLQQYTEKTPWSPRISREIVEVWDWLSSCEKKD